MEDIIIVLAIIGFYVYLTYKKFQKQQKEQAAKKATAQKKQAKPTMGEVFDEIFNSKEFTPTSDKEPVTVKQTYRAETTSQKSAKDSDMMGYHHFTYDENIPEEKISYAQKSDSKRSPIVDVIDNDDAICENISILDFDCDELYKGVIYSEILKNPYNQ